MQQRIDRTLSEQIREGASQVAAVPVVQILLPPGTKRLFVHAEASVLSTGLDAMW